MGNLFRVQVVTLDKNLPAIPSAALTISSKKSSNENIADTQQYLHADTVAIFIIVQTDEWCRCELKCSYKS